MSSLTSPKNKTTFFCQLCGAKYPKWLGKCTSCGEWNTIAEEVIEKTSELPWSSASNKAPARTVSLVSTEIFQTSEERLAVSDPEMQRVLGGGLVKGSVTLLSGEPGIGKSTLMLQFISSLNDKKVLYISGEESESQIKLRAQRINFYNKNCFLLTETRTQVIFQQIKETRPDVIIIDSIQTLSTSRIDSSPGTVSQVRECTYEFQRYAKESLVPVILVGHITKDGAIAGPKVLEHMVDTVLHFEGDHHHLFRLLRVLKNRFGSASEIGIYEMTALGLKPVLNPSQWLLSHHDQALSGITISATMEGLRPLLIETQALVSKAVYGTPQRSATGFDLRRLNMLLAVLEKRFGVRVSSSDVFLNIAGGLKPEDPATDLGIICAIVSSSEDIPVSPEICFAGEVGLSGEIRPVNRIEQRIAEAAKLGFKKFILSRHHKIPDQTQIELIPSSTVQETLNYIFS